jgi:hypothetical protein
MSVPIASLDSSGASARLIQARTLCQQALDLIDQDGGCLDIAARLQGTIDELDEKIGSPAPEVFGGS